MSKHRLNVNVTLEVARILKDLAKEYGTSIGGIICMLAKERDMQRGIVNAVDMLKVERELQKIKKE